MATDAAVAEPVATTIPPRSWGQAAVPASFTQERLWFESRYDAGSALYNSSVFLRLTGPLQLRALEQALNALRERHEILRTVFDSTPAGLLQVVEPYGDAALPVIDLSAAPAEEREQQAREQAGAAAHAPFDLAAGPLFRAELLRLAPDDHVLLLGLHHTIYDGWSRGVLVKDLAALYEAAAEGRWPDLPPLPVQYADYALWQREQLQGDGLDRMTSFWRDELTGLPPLELPTDHARPVERTFAGQVEQITLPEELAAAIAAFSRRHRATLFTTLASALQVLLHRYTDQDDLAVGFPVAGRSHVELERLIGPFINTLVLRADLEGDPAFDDFLSRQRRRVLQALTHQEMPFEQLLQDLHPVRDPARSPLFDVFMQLWSFPRGAFDKAGLHWERFGAGKRIAQFDLTFEVFTRQDGLRLAATYNTDLFEPGTIRRLLGHYETLLGGIVSDSGRRLSQLPLLTAPERRQLLVEFNATDREYPAQSCVHHLFREQARRTPGATAAACGEETITYEQLERRSDALAAQLVSLGVAPNVPVGLHLSRSLDIPLAIMATLKAGGACLPLEPLYPPDRLAHMIADAGAQVVLTSEGLPPEVRLPDDVVVINLRGADMRGVPPPVAVRPGDTAFITYTSGSTGAPKGVVLTHRACVSLLTDLGGTIYTPDVIAGTLLSTSISFDVGVWLVFVALTGGGCLIIPQNLLDLIAHPPARPVTYLDSVPSALTELLRHDAIPRTVHTVILGGEQAPGWLVRRLYEVGVQRVINQYGPTETTVTCTSAALRPDCPDHPPIGRPVANTRAYVLDKHANPVPLGVHGELCIGGVGVSPGYLNRPDLTAERFLPDPFSDRPGARMYRTGDTAKLDEEGNLYFLGRGDSQVKLRGQRIELDEVLAALMTHPAVDQAAVTVWGDAPGGPALAAYVARPDEVPLTAEDLRDHLRARLPQAMIPAVFTFLPSLPLRENGKVNTEALPPPEAPASSRPGVGTATPLERQLQHLWAEALQVPQVGLDDSFFDLGGHSLLAARLFARLQEELGQAPALPLIFRAPTVREFARALELEHQVDRDECLIEINAGADRPALFCAHHETGEPFCYVLMSTYLPDDQPVVGTRAPDDGLDDPALTLEELAATYVRAMLKRQPDGPYHLLGYSQAAKLAYEMAQQLQAQGRQVGLLALIDYPVDFRSYRYPHGLPRHFWQTLADFRWAFTYDGVLSPEERRHEWGNRWRLLARRLGHRPRKHDAAGADAQLDPEEHTPRRRRLDALLRAYQPGPYAGDVVLFRARQQSLSCSHERTMGWDKLVRGKLDIITISGFHARLMHDPFVRKLAQHLTDRLGADA